MANSLGSFTGVFTGEITFDWVPKPLLVANQLRAMGRALDMMGAPLEEAKNIARADVDERFQSKTDPSGAGWAEWSESYAASGRGVELMELTGDLRAGATSDSSFDVTVAAAGGEVFFTGAGMPEYGWFHQHGASGRTNRWGAPSPLPQRAFAGLSEKAEVAIIGEFDAWVGSIVGGFGTGTYAPVEMSHVEVFTHANGLEQFRIGGRWGPKVW